MPRLLSICCGLIVSLAAPAYAWDYAGHRAVNQLALEALPPDFPAFVKKPEARERIAFLAGEPDRWRNSQEGPLAHASSPDHYLDMEDLAELDYTPENLTEFRNLFIGRSIALRETHPERFKPINPKFNKDHTREIIGTLPWTIAEYYGRLGSAFSYLKAYQEHRGTPEEIANAEQNIIYLMGVMGHFVGDGAQPLHTSRNANGWEDPNPNGYTKARTFHAWIDGGFLRSTGPIDVTRLAANVKPAALISTSPDANGRNGIFSAVMQYIVEQHAKVEPLYQLDKDGKLTPANPASKEGRAFLENQLVIGAHELSSLWLTAWRSTTPDTYLIKVLDERQQK